MKSNKGLCAIMLGVIYFALMVTIIVIKLPVIDDKSIVSMAFLTIAYGIGIGVMLTSKSDKDSYFFRLPIYNMTITFITIETLVALVFIFAGIKNMLLIFLLQFFILIFLCLGVLKANVAINHVEKVEANVKDKKSFITDALTAIESVKIFTTDYELKKQISSLAEEMKYSTPKYSPMLDNIQYEIMTQINNLRMALNQNNTQLANEKIAYIRKLILERNNMCKNL